MDPATAIEVSKLAAEEFRRDYLVASVVVLILSHAVVNFFWARAFSRLVEKLSIAQEQRVVDQKEAKKELAQQLEENAEALQAMLMEAQARAKRIRASDTPRKIPEGTQP